jgi:hypothetical protein
MKWKRTSCCLVVAFVLFLLWLVFLSPQKRNWSLESTTVMTEVFELHLTNSWKNVKSTGITRGDPLGRKETRYLLIQEGNETGFRELKHSLEQLEQRHLNPDPFHILYLPEQFAQHDYDPNLSRIAPWWNPGEQGPGISAFLTTQYSNPTWRLHLDAFDHMTNVLLYIYLFKNE